MTNSVIGLGPILILVLAASLVGIVYGLIKKNRQIARISIIVFVTLALAVILLEVFFFE